MIAALNQRKIIAPLTFEGYCNTELFNAWFEQFLTPDPLRNKKITTQFVSLGTQITPIDDFASLRLSKQEDFLKT